MDNLSAENDIKVDETIVEVNENVTENTTEIPDTVAKTNDIEEQPDIQQILDKHEQNYTNLQEARKEETRRYLCDKKNVLASYYTQSVKEQFLLQYAENFNRQYKQLYSGRKELLFLERNEFGIKKFVSNTIRPTQLPFKELYDYRSCAKFVSEFVSYEMLDPPHELPKMVPSPTYTVKLQSGNCFDMSILLVSLLRGVGYDAYVVSGYGSKSITTMNQTKMSLESLVDEKPQENIASDVNQQEEVRKYKVKPPRQLKSSFITRQDEKRAANEKTAQAAMQKVKKEIDEDPDLDDELKGLRIHAWVLVLPGKRDIAEAFFIESSTGKIYSTVDENYLGLESVFSSMNYWVNMQVCYNGLKGISFDLADNSKWEFVLLDNTQTGAAALKVQKEEDKAGNGSDDEDNQTNEVVDMPPSWVDRISITKEQFESRCPAGSKVSIYKDAKLEVFAPYHRPDGMVTRITYFANNVIKETYMNRKDRLAERTRTPKENSIKEIFLPGRQHGLREHLIINGSTKEVLFYGAARPDGLTRIIHSPKKVLYFFEDREDKLSYRSVSYQNAEDDSNSVAAKMTEKFLRTPELPISQDIYKKTYFLKEDKIRIVYHLDNGRIVASTREFRKPIGDQKGLFSEFAQIFEVDPFLKSPKRQHLYGQLLELIRCENACSQAIKNAERELQEIVQLRATEEQDIGLTISVYDTIRNDTIANENDGNDALKGDEEESKSTEIDYLSPFLINYNAGPLSKADAIAVKQACLKSLRERLVEKGTIIQSQLEKVTADYQKRQAAYSRNADSMTVEETDSYIKFCNDALFKIHILEKRLAKHKETAPEKYIEFESKLRADPRLSLAYEK